MRAWSSLLASLVAALVLFAASARADELDEFGFARDAFVAGELQVAVARFEDLLARQAELSPRVLEASRRYLAAALVALGQADRARELFEQILRANPTATVDRFFFSADVVRLFEETRQRLEPQLRDIQESRRRARLAEIERRERARARVMGLLSREDLVVRVPRWLTFVPFGGGQFANGENGLGWFFLAAETTELVFSLAMYGTAILIAPQRPFPNTPPDESNAALYQTLVGLNVAGLSLLAVTAITGIVQANVAYRPERREVRTRPLPPDLRNLQISLRSGHAGPTMGLGIALMF